MPKAKSQPPVIEGDAPVADSASHEPEILVEKVVLTELYGFWTEDEPPALRMWQAGQEVTDPDEIELLVQRDAPITLHAAE